MARIFFLVISSLFLVKSTLAMENQPPMPETLLNPKSEEQIEYASWLNKLLQIKGYKKTYDYDELLDAILEIHKNIPYTVLPLWEFKMFNGLNGEEKNYIQKIIKKRLSKL